MGRRGSAEPLMVNSLSLFPSIFLSKYIAAILAAFVVTYLLTPVVRSGALALGIMDVPGDRRVHKHPTPRAGGLAILAGFHLAYLLAVTCGWSSITDELNLVWWGWFLAASGLLALVGLVDDYASIRPWTKLAGQVAAATIMFVGGARLGSVAGFELPLVVDYGMTLFWFLALTNAFNLIDGLDGLATGLALITLVGLAGALFLRRSSGDAMVLLMLAGACAAFLRYNFHPASIFLGDTGSMFLGFSLAAVSLSTSSKGTFMAAIGVPMLAMGVPIFDTMLAIWRRSLRKFWPKAYAPAQRPGGVMTADAEHIHHRFLRMGMKQHQVAIALYLINGALVFVGLLSVMFKTQAAAIYIVGFMAWSYLVFRHLARVEMYDTGRAIIYGIRRPARRQIVAIIYIVVDVGCLLLALVGSWVLTDFAVWEGNARTQLLRMVPIWVVPTFIAMGVSRMYSRVWSRAQMVDYLYLSLAIMAGTLASLGLEATSEGGISRAMLVHAAVFGLVAQFLVSGVRISFRGTRELMARLHHSEAFGPDVEAEKILLYGAGARCMLFLNDAGWSYLDSHLPRKVVGLVDDDPNMRRRLVYGHKVLGHGVDLPRLIEQYEVKRVVITTDKLSPETLDELQEICRAARVSLVEWSCGEIEWNYWEKEVGEGRESQRESLRGRETADPVLS